MMKRNSFGLVDPKKIPKIVMIIFLMTGFYHPKTGVIHTAKTLKGQSAATITLFALGAIFIILGLAILVAFKDRGAKSVGR